MLKTAKQQDTVTSSTLAERLAEQIRLHGPMTFRAWMEWALYDSRQGYYVRTDQPRWGREGDYFTSPQRSELFASTFARYFVRLYHNLGRPDRWTILECGAGDGTFAHGVLSTLGALFPEVFEATTFTIDEISIDARRIMAQRLRGFGERVQFVSLTNPDPISVGIVFSNELFDAFPVHLLTLINGRVQEIYVAATDSGGFMFTPGEPSTPKLTEFCIKHEIEPTEGQMIEINLGIEEWLTTISEKLKKGYLITVDYGAEAAELFTRTHGTLRAYSRHQLVDDVLIAPGQHDITCSVNWSQVMTTGARLGFEVVEFEQQDKFLLHAGLPEELQRRLDETAGEANRLDLTTAAREMILPGGMASSFQVLVQRRLEE